jgi:hypothetical protein
MLPTVTSISDFSYSPTSACSRGRRRLCHDLPQTDISSVKGTPICGVLNAATIDREIVAGIEKSSSSWRPRLQQGGEPAAVLCRTMSPDDTPPFECGPMGL